MNIEQQSDQLISIESHKVTLIFIIVFNLIDAILTLYWVIDGQAVEANPLMASALEIGPIAFMFCKIAVVSLGLTILWIRRRRAWVRLAALIILGLYSYVMMIHTFFIFDVILGHF